MNRALTYRFLAEDQGKTLQWVLQNRMHLTKREISRAKFLNQGICVNGIQRRISFVPLPGDQVQVLFTDLSSGDRVGKERSGQENKPVFPGERHVTILYEDEDVLAVDKPSGVVCHPSHGHYADSLADRIPGFPGCGADSYPIRCIGRLDKDTSGIVLFAKNRLAAARLSGQRSNHCLKKQYAALVQGSFPASAETGIITLPMERDPADQRKMRICVGGQPRSVKNTAVTHYEVLCQDQAWALVRFWLETGRTHQIRVHMAAIGHPLFGDPLYGNGTEGQTRTALHAEQLTFRQPVSGEIIRLNSFPGRIFQ